VVQDRVTKTLDVLIAGERTGATKINKAEKYGVEVWDDEEFSKIIKGWDSEEDDVAGGTDVALSQPWAEIIKFSPEPLRHHLAATEDHIDLSKRKSGVFPGAENFGRVIGIHPLVTGYMYDCLPQPRTRRWHETPWVVRNDYEDRLKTWEAVPKGKKLFIPNLERFDILKVYSDEILRRREEQWLRIFGYAYNDRLNEEVLRLDPKRQGARLSKDAAARALLDLVPSFNVYNWMAALKRDGMPWNKVLHKTRLVPQRMMHRCAFTGLEDFSMFLPYYVHEDKNRRGRLWWLLSVHEVQALGHFPLAFEQAEDPRWNLGNLAKILSLDEEHPVRQHVLRNHAYWNNLDNAGSLDELVDILDWRQYIMEHHDVANYTPDRLLEALRPRQEPHLHIEPNMHIEPNIQFDFLSTLEDVGDLVVLRSTEEMVEAGRRLHNCAGTQMWKALASQGSSILVALRRGEDRGTWVALGFYCVYTRRWTQIKGMCNREIATKENKLDKTSPDGEIYHLFYDYQKNVLDKFMDKNGWNRSKKRTMVVSQR